MAFRMIRYVGIAMFLWLFVIGFHVYQLVEEAKKSASELKIISAKVTQLKYENDKLKETSSVIKRSESLKQNENSKFNKADERKNIYMLERLSEADKKIRELTITVQQHQKTKLPTTNHAILGRRISNQLREMLFLVSGQIKKLQHVVPKESLDGFKSFEDSFRELDHITERDFEELLAMDGASKEKDNLAIQMSKVVQERLHRLQNPDNCATARKLVCSLNKGCGYGCQMHHVLYCFIVAYSTGRTLIINSSGWRYSSKGWTGYFESVSDTCIEYSDAEEWSRDHEQHTVVHLPIVDSLFPRPKQMPQAVPSDLYEQLQLFHGHPFVWWIAQFCKYLFRYKPNLKAEIEAKKKELKFKSPVVGIQVRRTDKINLEAAYHDISEYMYYVDLHYKKLALSTTVDQKRVFIASDDASVLKQARRKYPDYVFLSDAEISRSAKLSSRYSDTSLHGVITDIDLLSETDFLVCTFSSQVCRMAYEIMNHKHTDASRKFRSLDDIYYFGGQNEHKVKAIWPHTAKRREEVNLDVGDVIGIAGNHWDGEAKGLVHGKKTGLFPAFKVEDVNDAQQFPVPRA